MLNKIKGITLNNLKLRLSSQDEINQVYQDIYVKKAFIRDNIEFAPINHELVTYYSCYYNDEFMGCFMYIQFSINEIECHSMLLKKAIPHSRIFGKMFIDLCFSKNEITRLTTYIPENLSKAINFLKKLGWEIEGIKRNSTLINGKLLNNILLGITRKDYNVISR